MTGSDPALAATAITELLTGSQDGVVVMDRDGSPQWINAAARRLLTGSHETAASIERPLREVWDLLPRRFLASDASTGDRWTGEMMTRGLDGIARTLVIEMHLRRDDHGEVRAAAILLRDVSEARRLHRELVHQATHDALTELPNRTHGLALLARMLDEDDAVVAVMFVDLDHLKDVNDSVGHEAGDELIRHCAHMLRTTTRPDDVVARFGGDEFVVAASGLSDDAEAMEIAERIRDALAEGIVIAGRRIATGASIGVATWSGDSSPHGAGDPASAAAELVDRADTAMYRAKRRGRGRCERFDPDSEPSREARPEILGALEILLGPSNPPTVRTGTRTGTAVPDPGRLEVDFDEIRAPGTPRRHGLCARARWISSSGDAIGGDDLTDVLTRSGLDGALGLWLVDAAVAGFASLPGPRHDLGDLEIPLSGATVQRPDLVEAVTTALERHQIDASRIVMRVLASTLTDPDADQRRNLASMRRLGIRLAAHHLGGPTVDLGPLSTWELDRIVVDPTAVEMAVLPGAGRHGESVLRALVVFAHGLDALVIAPLPSPVPTRLEAALSTLDAMGVDLVEVATPRWATLDTR